MLYSKTRFFYSVRFRLYRIYILLIIENVNYRDTIEPLPWAILLAPFLYMLTAIVLCSAPLQLFINSHYQIALY